MEHKELKNLTCDKALKESSDSLVAERATLEKLTTRVDEYKTQLDELEQKAIKSTDLDYLETISEECSTLQSKINLLERSSNKQRDLVESAQSHDFRLQRKRSICDEVDQLQSRGEKLDPQLKRIDKALATLVKELHAYDQISGKLHPQLVAGKRWFDACNAVDGSYELKHLLSVLGRNNPNELDHFIFGANSDWTPSEINFDQDIKIILQNARMIDFA